MHQGIYNEPGSSREAERELLGQPLTVGYRPSMVSQLGLLNDSGRFGGLAVMLRDVEGMLSHPAVLSPYGYYKSGIATCKFKVKGQNKKQEEFALGTLNRFWERSLRQAQLSYDYGWCGYEVFYRLEKGLFQFDSIQDLHPLDTWAVTYRGKYRGLSVQGGNYFYGTTPNQKIFLWGPRHWPSKGLWLNHNIRWNRWYGRSQLYGGWRPWRRLAIRDAAEEIVDAGVYRFAYKGPVMRYPPEAFRGQNGEVDYDAAREKAREFTENAKAGVSVALPNSRDDKGNYKWEFEWPQHTLNVSGLLEYLEELKKEISLGVGVPPELLQASDTGSGWSGRKVPLIGFYTQQLENARSIVRQFQWQVLDPLLRWNFGKNASVTIETEVVVPTAVSGTQPAENGAPGQPGAGQDPMAAMMQAAGGGGSPPDSGGDEESGSGLADLLAGKELSTTIELSLADYKPHRLLAGPRKGMFVWKNFRTGKIRTSLPGSGKPGVDEEDGRRRGAEPLGVLARIRHLLRNPGEINDAIMRDVLDDLFSLDPDIVKKIQRRVEMEVAA